MERLSRDPHGVTVADITHLYTRKPHDVGLLQRAMSVEALPESWRTYFQDWVKKARE